MPGDAVATEPNWKNRTLWTGRDNIEVMRGMNSDSIDLIYLDPPFNSNKTYSAPIGSRAAGASFRDFWTFDDVDRVWLALQRSKNPTFFHVIEAARLAHSSSMAAYLGMMAQRLAEMRRLLKPTGSIYLHCDPTASHYLKMVMDCLFGRFAYRNEVVWTYKGLPSKQRQFLRKHDIILFYSNGVEWTWNPQFEPVPDNSARTYKSAARRGYNVNLKKKMVTVWDWDKYNRAVEAGTIPDDLVPREFSGGAPPMRDSWNDIKILGGPKNKERTGYPTQKPLRLLHRILHASSDPGSMVLDPFCGCATTCVAAEQLGRQWVGIDIAKKAAELVRVRLQEAADEHGGVRPSLEEVIHRTDIPQRTDLGELPPYKTHKDYLYGVSGGFCGGCGVHFQKRNLTVDHIVPKSKGGTDHQENLWLLCGACNSSKGTKTQAEFIQNRMSIQGIDMNWLEKRVDA